MKVDINYKFYVFKRILKEKGFGFALKKLLIFLLSPLSLLIKRNVFLLNFFYGTLPILRQKFFPVNSGLIKFPKSELVEKVRYFWYANIPDNFNLDGEKISRKDIFTYGGPNPKFICPICQKSEWLSRIKQENLFVSHSCSQVKECEDLCQKQGDELWINFHQNFDFSIGCDANLPAPKGLLIMPEDKNSEAGGFYHRFQRPGCDQWMLVFRRRLAYTCQVDVCRYPISLNWNAYDFIFVPNTGVNQKFSRPSIPVIMYGHDFWPLKDKSYQWVIDWLKPDVLLTPYLSQWKEYFRISPQTKIVFYPFFDSLFFARPTLNQKELDLLVVGSLASDVYQSRITLTNQILKLTDSYKIAFSQVLPLSASWLGKVDREDPVKRVAIRYLNKWSEHLGSAKYVIFGRMKYPILVSKYYEILGSGAVPIFPEAPDLKYLHIEPFEHYIPLSEVEGNNEKLTYFLDNYEKYKYIAKNAVKWYKENSDKMTFSDFEDLIREITGYKFPQRIV